MVKKSINLISLILLLVFSGCVPGNEIDDFVGFDSSSPCLYFLSRVEGDSGLHRVCNNEPPEKIVLLDGIQMYDLALEARKVVYSQILENGESSISIADASGDAIQEIVNCGTDRCESLAITPDGSIVYYSRYGRNNGLFAINPDTKEIKTISESLPDLVDLSPNGQYLRFHETDSGLLRVISTETLDLFLSFPADTDLVGGWLPEGTGFLVGERNVDGQILISEYMEIDVLSQTQQQVFILPKGVEFFRPIYADKEQIFVLARSGVRNNSREVHLIMQTGEIVSTITNASAYDHSTLQWNPVDKQLAFQRYDITRSDSVPEIMLWQENTSSETLVAQNAVLPQWLY